MVVMAYATTDHDEIVRLYVQGLGPAEIVERLGLSISKRQVQRIVEKRGLSRPVNPRTGRKDEDNLEPMLHQIVEQCLIDLRGLDPYVCTDCGRRMKKKCDIHHTKYEGATIYDLEYLCRRCNTSLRNTGLA